MNGPTYENDWREKLAHYAPSPTDKDWDAMRKLMQESPAAPAKSSRRVAWWLYGLLLLAVAGGVVFFPSGSTEVSDFPVPVGDGGTSASTSPAAVHRAEAPRQPTTLLPILPTPSVQSARKIEVELVPARIRLRPVEVLPSGVPPPLPLPTAVIHFDSLPSVEIEPVSRSYYPTPLNLKKRQR